MYSNCIEGIDFDYQKEFIICYSSRTISFYMKYNGKKIFE